jgi:hypothetical protein
MDDFPGPDDGGGGIPSGFVVLFVLVAIAGLITTVVRFSMTKQAGKDAGLSDSQATKLAVFGGDNAYDTAVMASALKSQQTDTSAPTVRAQPTVEQRLAKLQSLLSSGSITQAEYDERRAEIIDSI